MRAWLIEWKWVGDDSKVEKPLIAIMNWRISGHHMLKIIEQYYVNEMYSLSERIAYAKNKNTNPYPAYFGPYKNGDCTWEVYCGHNPYIYARHVDDVKVVLDGNGEEVLTWKEPEEFIKGYQSSESRSLRSDLT